MPVIRDIPITLDMERVLRYQGIGERSNLQPQSMDLLAELLAIVNDSHLLEPAIAYELHPINKMQHNQLRLENGAVLHGTLLPSLLTSARELAAVVCTIGPRLEEKVAYYFASNEPLRGLMLDGIGSAAVEALSQEACRFVEREAASYGYRASGPLNPGMSGWPISDQWHLFRLAPAEQIGIRLTSLAVMVPRKSMSMVIGMGAELPAWKQGEACSRCNLKETCPYKVHARSTSRRI